MSRVIVAAFALALYGACGGNVVFDEAAASSSASVSSASSSSGGSDACPANMPTAEAPCSIPAGMTCDYGDCCPNVLSCLEGKWSKSTSPCPNVCPSSLPVSGSTCTCEATTCHYSEDAGSASATCNNGAWTLM